MKTYKLIWGGELNTKIPRNLMQSEGNQGNDTGGQTTNTYIEPTGETQHYPINQVLVTPGNLTAWGSLTINWLNSEVQQQTQEVDSTQNWAEQQDSDFGGS